MLGNYNAKYFTFKLLCTRFLHKMNAIQSSVEVSSICTFHSSSNRTMDWAESSGTSAHLLFCAFSLCNFAIGVLFIHYGEVVGIRTKHVIPQYPFK